MVGKLLLLFSLFQSPVKLHVVNNTQLPLPVSLVTPQIDTAVSYLGTVRKCSSRVFKVEAIPGAVSVVSVADAHQVLELASSDNHVMEFSAADTGLNCPKFQKIVFAVVEFVDPSIWRSSGYAKLDEPSTPVNLVLAGDGTLCPLWNISVNDPPKRGEPWVCNEAWRARRK